MRGLESIIIDSHLAPLFLKYLYIEETIAAMSFDLEKLLKALLFSTSEPLKERDIQKVIKRYHEQRATEKTDEDSEDLELEAEEEVPSLVSPKQIKEALESIDRDLKEKGEVYRLHEGPQGFYLVNAPEFAEWIRLLRDDPKPLKLSSAAMETLAIIAYRQPATRSEIEVIRGVSSDSGVNKLVDHELVKVVGRADLPGRPIQYGTTDKFLEFCGIESLESLPVSDVLNPNQITEWVRESTQADAPSDEDVGLAEPEGEDVQKVELLEDEETHEETFEEVSEQEEVAEELEPANA